ncbi:MAG: hypothetical protein KC516_03030 [Nanoarchaeota archaeon]|nr:hypothetical protein [Nanoarchaeota archaeon]
MSDIKFEVVSKLSKFNMKSHELRKISKFESVSPPSVFVGSKLKYPQVNVGILSPLEGDEKAWIYDASKYWAQENFSILDVVQLRNNLLNSRFKSNVQDARLKNRFVEIAKEIAIASKPVDVEIELKNRIDSDGKKDRILSHQGMKASLKDAKVISNVKISQKVDKAINDDIKAVEGISYLYKNNVDEYSLSKILSVGVLGMKKDKRMVPTRWSITATDDMISKEVLGRVRNYPWINDYQLFFGEFLGNQYLILLFPHFWSFELFELYYPGSSWNPSTEMKASTDYEGFYGRKNYASNCAGGYYATRFPIAEYLDSIKRQAGVLAIRLETPSYWAGLGVWVVRESVRKALRNKGMKFSSRKEFLESVYQISRAKYKFNPNEILEKSKLLKDFKSQKSLRDFF